jgi:hypothetical protein
MDNGEFLYESIPNSDNDGEIVLSIKKPGAWFGSIKYSVFVGGCGVAEADTLEKAEVLLKEKAVAHLLDRIGFHRREANYYEKQLCKFKLKRRKTKLRLVRREDGSQTKPQPTGGGE